MFQMDAFSAARTQMTYQQVRAWSVLPSEVLDVFEQLPRENFVPQGWQGVAYADFAIPLGHGQHMLTPSVVGRILQAVTVRRTESVLEVGTGSGYLTACLARLAANVHSLEIESDLAAAARTHLRAAGIGSATVEEVDAFNWSGPTNSYDVVVLTGSIPQYDARFETLLKPNGRLFATIGVEPVMEARLVRLNPAGAREEHSLFETVIDPLRNAVRPSRFAF
jgi:protein-L-isoaspartate(D-aspartate) O-methyltransferase